MAVYEFPDYEKIKGCKFNRPDNVVSTSIGGGLAVNITELVPSFLTVSITTLSFKHFSTDRTAWRGFKARLKGGLNMFCTYDIERCKPIFYGGAALPSDVYAGWSGVCSIVQIGVGGALTLGGLPPNFVLSAGDSIGFEQSGRFDIYEISEGDIATSATGLTATLSVVVAPFVRIGIFNESAIVRIWKPRASFVIDSGSWSDGAGGLLAPVSFSGTQRI